MTSDVVVVDAEAAMTTTKSWWPRSPWPTMTTTWSTTRTSNWPSTKFWPRRSCARPSPEDDDEAPLEVDPLLDTTEAILPKQDDEFRCKSCRLLKKTSQLADKANMLCRDCV